MDDLARLDATAQAALVRQGSISPLELVEAAIARIERLDGQLNAVPIRRFEEACAEAQSPRLPDGPFHGVPLLLKDYGCHIAGAPYYEGTRFGREADWRAPHTTHLAAKYSAAGFVVLGSTTVPELAMSGPGVFGPAHNPWDLERSPSGSSSGSAVAVAAGLVPLAHGNDGYGSLRIPASACGLVGLKPSRGRISRGPAGAGGLLGNVVDHVLTRTVRDCAAVLDASAGAMPGDLFVAPTSQRAYLAEVGANPGSLHIGLLLDDLVMQQPLHPACRAATLAAACLLEALGHRVEEAYPPALSGATGLGEALRIVAASGLAARLDQWAERIGRPIRADDVRSEVWVRAELGRSYSAVQLHSAMQRLLAGVMRLPEWWQQGWDVLLTPTVQQPPPLLADDVPEQAGVLWGLWTMPYSVSGQPAISLPLYWTGGRLPIGVQLVADYGREDVLLRLAAQLEAAQPWAERWPPFSGVSS